MNQTDNTTPGAARWTPCRGEMVNTPHGIANFRGLFTDDIAMVTFETGNRGNARPLIAVALAELYPLTDTLAHTK